MKPTKVLQEIRKMRFEEVYELRNEKRLSVESAAEILRVNERTFRCWVTRYEEKGAEGLLDE
jgi:DNA-binding transcriptional regulator YiaG